MNLPLDVLSVWRAHEWWHAIDAVRSDLRALLPPNAEVLVADDYAWALRHTLAGFPIRQLAADDPADTDGDLLRQTRAAVADGVTHLVLAPCSSWWLQSFVGWSKWVNEHAKRVPTSGPALIFRLGDADV
jgi:hypothetical protein